MTKILEAVIVLAPVWCALSALTLFGWWAIRQLHIRYRWWRVRREIRSMDVSRLTQDIARMRGGLQ